MRGKLEFINTTANPEEVIALVRSVFGNSAHVEIGPTSNSAEDCIDFGIEKLITTDQLTAYFNGAARYEVDLPKVKGRVLKHLESRLDRVIEENEKKYQ